MEVVSSSGGPRPSTGAQGARSSPDPPRPKGEHRPRGEIGKRCFAEQTRTGAELAFPRRVSLLRRQLPEARFVPFLRWALGGSLPLRRRVGCCGQCTDRQSVVYRTSVGRGGRRVMESRSGDPRPSSSAQGTRGSPDPPRPKGEHRPRGETGKRCFAEQTRPGAVLAFPRRVSVSINQKKKKKKKQ